MYKGLIQTERDEIFSQSVQVQYANKATGLVNAYK